MLLVNENIAFVITTVTEICLQWMYTFVISHNWFRYWFVAEKSTSHYLYQWWLYDYKFLTCSIILKIIKMHWHFDSYLGFHSTNEDQIHNGADLHVSYPTLLIPCLLMTWRLQEPGHQQAWYWPNRPAYSVPNIRRDKWQTRHHSTTCLGSTDRR